MLIVKVPILLSQHVCKQHQLLLFCECLPQGLMLLSKKCIQKAYFGISETLTFLNSSPGKQSLGWVNCICILQWASPLCKIYSLVNDDYSSHGRI